MGQYWEIFNICLGKVLPRCGDGFKYCEKSISIDLLLYLLQNEWSMNKIVMVGDYDETEEGKRYTREFLEAYSLQPMYDNSFLFHLWADDMLPKAAYDSSFVTTFTNLEAKRRLDLFFKKKNCEDLFAPPHYFIPNYNPYGILQKENEMIEYKPVYTEDSYYLVDHTSHEYVEFNRDFFYGFYDKSTKRPVQMTIVQYNQVVKTVVLGLITHNSEEKDTIHWHGRFAGHILSFRKKEDFEKIPDESLQDISHIFTNKSDLCDKFNRVIYTLNPALDLDLEEEEE